MWLSGDNIPMRTAAVDGSYMTEINNLHKGSQPASLFEVPAGYTVQHMPNMMNMKGKNPADYMKLMKSMPKM
jgi:hypothetical protein